MEKQTTNNLKENNIFSQLGIFLITCGLLFLVEQILHTGWLYFLIPLIFSLIIFIWAFRTQKDFWFLFSLILVTSSIALIIQTILISEINYRLAVGLGFISLALAFILYFALKVLYYKVTPFWSFIVFILSLSIAIVILFTDLRFLDFVFFIGLGFGLALLSAGLYWRLFGLVIPGSLLIGISPGLFYAWEQPTSENPLVQTSVMLVWFALGWGLITIFSRVLTSKFVWWPLIPGGILAMVGWGLYIGGNPTSAISFIGNTGSIALIIFGIYILLIKRSIHH